MKESKRKVFTVIAGILVTVLFCFFVNGMQLDSEFEIVRAVPTPYSKQDAESDITTDEKININTADEKLLDELPGIGEKMAQRIIDYRKENGEFKQIQDIMKVRGIGKDTFKNMENLICVE